MSRLRNFAVLAGLVVLGLTGANPLDAADYHFFTFGVGGGYTTQVGITSNNLDNGGHLQATGGINLGILGLGATFMYHGMGLTGSTLTAVNVPDGHANVYSFTVEPKIRVPFLPVGVYVLAGGGWMRRTVVFTRPVLAQTFIFNPWWGYFGPALVPANQTLGSVASDAGVWDVGGGVDIPLPRTSWKLFLEARYFEGMTSQTQTRLIPVSVGIRW